MISKSAHAGVALGDHEPAAQFQRPESRLDDQRSAYLRSASRVKERGRAGGSPAATIRCSGGRSTTCPTAAPEPLHRPPAWFGGYWHRIINLVILVSGTQIKCSGPTGVCGRRRKTMGFPNRKGRLVPAIEKTLLIQPHCRRKGRLMQVSHRMVKTRSRVAKAACTLRIRLVSDNNSSFKCEKEKQSCTDW